MVKNISIEEELNGFLELWGGVEMTSFLEDIIPLMELFDVDETDDWVLDAVGPEHIHTIRIARSIYLISKIAENHSPRLCSLKVKFPGLWKRMEKTL